MNFKRRLLFLLFAFSFYNLFSQSCAMEDITNPSLVQGASSHGLLSTTGRNFFAGNDGCSRVTLDVNYIFLYKDDGTGNWNFNNPAELQFLTDVLNGCENTLKHIWGTGCPNDASSYSGFEVNSVIHRINNTAAWNLDLCSPVTFGSPCGNDSDLCNNEAYNATIDGIINSIGGNNAINVYFGIEGDIWDTDYASNRYLSVCDRPEEAIGFWTGRFPNPHDLTQLNKSQIANFYLSYLWRLNRPECILDDNGVPYDPQDIMDWYESGSAWTLAHEIGHTLGLTHVNCQHNVMDPTPGGGMVHSQVATINRSLAIKNVRNARRSCENHVGCAFTLSEGEMLRVDFDTWIDRDIIIESDATLIVEKRMSMANGAEIIVKENGKLIVDGGIITSCGNNWSGIRVHGGNSDFDVKFTDGAIIENVDGSAVSMFAAEPWPQIQQYGNGILQADNTTFNNVKRMVEFMSWSPLPNPSYVRNCVHNGGKWSITNWNCQNIEITDNVFYDISHNCIGTETGSFLIQGNEFNSGQNDILFNNVSAGIHTRVLDNTFYGKGRGYHARGTSFAQNIIKNNTFSTTGRMDIFNDGHNSYDIDNNELYCIYYGSLNYSSGTGVADVRNNSFNGNRVGAGSIGESSDYNFFENCYETTVVDNYINGQISPVVHSGGGAANNCFTHGGNINSSITDIGGSPEPFAYLEPNDELRDCRDAILAHPNVNRVFVGGEHPLPACAQGIINNPDNDQYCWPNPDNYEEVQNAYTWLQNKLNAIEQNASLSEAEKAELRSIYSKCLKRVKGYLFEQYAATGAYQDARSLYQNESSSDDAKVFVFSSYILENNLAQARTYLNALAPHNEQMLDFITIQNINLDRLPYGPFYDATLTELNTVRSIAIKTHPYAAYAKALYYVLTGEIISSELPVIENGGERRPHFRTQVSKETKIYPNPFDATLQIDIVGEDVVVLDIYDMFGQKVYSVTTEPSSLHISTATWKAGMYLIHIKNQDEIIKTEKVLLVR